MYDTERLEQLVALSLFFLHGVGRSLGAAQIQRLPDVDPWEAKGVDLCFPFPGVSPAPWLELHVVEFSRVTFIRFLVSLFFQGQEEGSLKDKPEEFGIGRALIFSYELA